jgi:hypothetical protein
LRLLGEVLDRLESEGIAHALIGAAAMAIHGVSRSTADVDLLTLDDRVLLRSTWMDFEARGLVKRLLKGDSEDPLAGSVRLADGGEVVDVILGRYGWQRETLDAAERYPLGDLSLRVVSPSGLVLLKLHAGGPKDAWDIRSLLEIVPDPEVLVGQVERVLPRLPGDARRLWSRLRDEK